MGKTGDTYWVEVRSILGESSSASSLREEREECSEGDGGTGARRRDDALSESRSSGRFGCGWRSSRPLTP